jgi:cysteinyl-tRNA synthetase
MRAYVFADTLRRALRWKDLPARHVVSITDVGHVVAETELGEDKVESAAHQEQRSVWEIAEFYTAAFFADLTALRILPAGHYPRATAYIPEMIRFQGSCQHAHRGMACRLQARPSGVSMVR